MLQKIRIGWLSIKELGLKRVGLYSLYRLGLILGIYRWLTPAKRQPKESVELVLTPIFTIPARERLGELLDGHQEILLQEADQISRGFARLFGGGEVRLSFNPQGTEKHWTRVRMAPGEDIKLIWEPSRFGWAFTLGRAYQLTGNETYPEAFWHIWEQFSTINPINCGPNWVSGQEIALRLIAYLFALQVFDHSIYSSPERKSRLMQAVSDHTNRIPPTLIYARAQDNNHLISEACGLYLAGVALGGHPRADQWRKTGWRWLEKALLTQVDADGTYLQHSMNYHRMVLHLALLAQAGADRTGERFSDRVLEKLAAATRWLAAQMDAKSGDAPNLGHNDGSHILPLAAGGFRDHRAVVQAAAAAFLGEKVLPVGSWDELPAWLGRDFHINPDEVTRLESPAVRRLGIAGEWATLRAVQYRARPAHADQLHVELWIDGINVLRDSGTYSYSHFKSWDNHLVHARFHNTLTIDELDPMLRAGKFLWLDWDQASWMKEDSKTGRVLAAEHDGYEKIGIHHRRSLEWIKPGEWEVIDRVSANRIGKPRQLSVHWQLMAGDISLKENILTVSNHAIKVTMQSVIDPLPEPRFVNQGVVSGGEVLFGDLKGDINTGWYSPTYGVLEPAISYQISFPCEGTVKVITRLHVERV